MPFGEAKASGYGRFGGKTGVVELQSCDGSAMRLPRSTARSDLPSWAVDETCLKVHGRWCLLSRTVDRSGTLVDVLFSEHRNMAIAQAFFRSATAVTGITPERVTIDGHVGSTVAKLGDLGVRVHSYPRAIRTTLGKGVRYRTGAYLNNRLERITAASKAAIGPCGAPSARDRPPGSAGLTTNCPTSSASAPATINMCPPTAEDCSTSAGPRPCWPSCKPHNPGLASSQLRRSPGASPDREP